MAKGKSLGKNKRDESTSASKSTTRKMQKAARAPSASEKKVKAPVGKRALKSSEEEIEISESAPATVKRASRRTVRAKDAARGKSPLVERETTPSPAEKSASDAPKIGKSAARSSRKSVRESASENLDVTTKTARSSASVAKPLKRRAKATETLDDTNENTPSAAKTGGRRAKKIVAAPEFAETRDKTRVAKGATVVEPAEAEKKTRRGRPPKTVSQVANEPSEVAEETPKTKRARKRVVELDDAQTFEPTPEAEASIPTKRRVRRATKKSATLAEESADPDDERENVLAAKKKRRLKTVENDAEDEEDREKTEKRRRRSVKRRRRQIVAADEDDLRQSDEPSSPDDDDDQAELDSDFDADADPDDEFENESEDESEDDVVLTRGGKTKRRAAKEKSTRTSRALFTKQSPDYLQLSVVNSYWLCAQWVVSESNLNRVRSAMGRLWHTAEPNLRVYRVDKNAQHTTMRRVHIADVPVRLPVRVWYAPVDNPPSAFAVELGYLSRDAEFFTLSSSGVVETSARLINDPTPLPPPLAPRWGVASSIPYKYSDSEPSSAGENVSDESEAQLSRVEPKASLSGFSSVSLKVDAEVVVKGRVSPGAILKIRDERVVPSPNGVFAVRLELPERRHVFPIVASSYDGSETQTIILAIDRNTKTLETVFRDDDD